MYMKLNHSESNKNIKKKIYGFTILKIETKTLSIIYI